MNKKLNRLEVRISSEDKERLKRKADKENKPIAQVVRDAAMKECEKEET